MTADIAGRLTGFPQGLGKKIVEAVGDDKDWLSYISCFAIGTNQIHLAVMVDPYMSLSLDGKKTIETRFSIRRVSPYHRITKGDIILMKRPGKRIVGICGVSNAWFYELDPTSWRKIKTEFASEISAQPKFWRDHRNAMYATLIRLLHPRSIDPVRFDKQDKRGWVTLSPRTRIDYSKSPQDVSGGREQLV